MDAADRSGFYRGLGLALVALGSFIAGAVSPPFSILTAPMETWAVMLLGAGTAGTAIAFFPTPLSELGVGFGFALLGSLLLAVGVPDGLWVVSVPCVALGIILRIFNNY